MSYGGDTAEDPTIATLKFYYKSYGGEEDHGAINFRPIRTKTCTDVDLNNADGTSGESKFYPLSSQYQESFNTIKKSMKCLDEEVEIYGDYNSDRAKHLVIAVEKCDRALRNDCKGDK